MVHKSYTFAVAYAAIVRLGGKVIDTVMLINIYIYRTKLLQISGSKIGNFGRILRIFESFCENKLEYNLGIWTFGSPPHPTTTMATPPNVNEGPKCRWGAGTPRW